MGSTFRCRLPAVRTDALGEAAPEGAATPARTGLRILVAEDNATNRLVIDTLLTQIGVSPTMVGNGAEAVDAWRLGDWDAILMDVQMPVMDGVTATRRIRELELEDRRPRTPIIALTANAMAHQTAQYAAAGMDGFAAKPIELSRLVQAINEAIRRVDEAQASSAA